MPSDGRIPLACAEFSFLSLPHEAALDVIAELGFDGVDVSLMAGYGHVPAAEVLERPEEWGRGVRAMLAGRGLAAADVTFLPGGDFEKLAVNHPDAGERERAAGLFRRALAFTSAADCRHMTMLPGVAWPQDSGRASLVRSAEELAWRVAEARESGVALSVEAHVGSVAPAPADAVELVERTPGLTLTLDLTHFVCQGFAVEDCLPLLQWASHFHARGGAPGRLQVASEDNIIDYESVLQAMKRNRYPGYFEVEYEWNEWGGCNRVDVLSETILMRDVALRSR